MSLGRLPLSLVLDPLEEEWPSMDLVGDMLHEQLRTTHRSDVDLRSHRLRIVRTARRVPGMGRSRTGFNVDRLLTRLVAYPVYGLALGRARRFFHVVDHTYAQVANVLPAERTGVFCHDIDAFRTLLEPGRTSAGGVQVLARGALRGMRRAAIVFHSTRAVRAQLISNELVHERKLVHAPYGVSQEFLNGGSVTRSADETRIDEALGLARGYPYILHVGSGIARKRLDVLFEVFARLRAERPDLYLVQQGADLSSAQRAHVARLGLAPWFVQPPKLSRPILAGLYRRARALLLPSDAEGFGFPIVEGLACGVPVVASDLPVLREVGGGAALYCRVADVEAWTTAVRRVLEGQAEIPPKAMRVRHASTFTWESHSRRILDAYADVRLRLRKHLEEPAG